MSEMLSHCCVRKKQASSPARPSMLMEVARSPRLTSHSNCREQPELSPDFQRDGAISRRVPNKQAVHEDHGAATSRVPLDRDVERLRVAGLCSDHVTSEIDEPRPA